MRILSILSAALLVGLASCNSWRPAAEYEDWTLYVQSGDAVEPEPFEAVVAPAIAAVEERLGPFEDRVNIHAWHGGVEMQAGNRGRRTAAHEESIADVPGIGPARVRAFHTRSDGGWWSNSGIFIGSPEAGTMVHELVHARLAERPYELPLWFEEGYASVLGDGVLHDGVWTVDGLACWPWRELREEQFTDADLQRLLDIRASDDHTVRENVLVHFVGWAIVYDLYRETGSLDADALLAHFGPERDQLYEARKRLNRTLSDETPVTWMERMSSEDVGVRFATAKGTWKLASSSVVRALLRSLRDETDDEVRVAIAVNCLAAAGERRLGRRTEGWMWGAILPIMREAPLADEAEREALESLYRAYRRGRSRVDTQEALNALSRFWQE